MCPKIPAATAVAISHQQFMPSAERGNFENKPKDHTVYNNLNRENRLTSGRTHFIFRAA